jgi:hypothetical protein
MATNTTALASIKACGRESVRKIASILKAVYIIYKEKKMKNSTWFGLGMVVGYLLTLIAMIVAVGATTGCIQ